MNLAFAAGRARLAAGLSLAIACPAHAVEYLLQFTPVPPYQDLVVGGYQIVGKQVIGNCSYTHVTSGSGRGGKTIYTPMPATCTWDLYGDLLSSVSGAPAIPSPIAVVGTETVYAGASNRLYAGYDSALPGGFVFTFGSHYTWLTSNAYLVLPQQPYTFTATLRSDGDKPLTVSAVKATNVLAKATLVVDSTTCLGQIPVGGTCDVTLTYDDSKVATPSGLAYDTFTIHLASNTGHAWDFVQGVTDEVRVGGD